MFQSKPATTVLGTRSGASRREEKLRVLAEVRNMDTDSFMECIHFKEEKIKQKDKDKRNQKAV